mgnify:CR=1 FL=1
MKATKVRVRVTSEALKIARKDIRKKRQYHHHNWDEETLRHEKYGLLWMNQNFVAMMNQHSHMFAWSKDRAWEVFFAQEMYGVAPQCCSPLRKIENCSI